MCLHPPPNHNPEMSDFPHSLVASGRHQAAAAGLTSSLWATALLVVRVLLCAKWESRSHAFYFTDALGSLGSMLSVVSLQLPAVKEQLYEDRPLERKPIVICTILEKGRLQGIQTTTNWTHASPKAALNFLFLDLILTEQAVVVFWKSLIVVFLSGRGRWSKEKDLIPSTLA